MDEKKMRNLPTYDEFMLVIEKNRTVEFFRQHPELLSKYSTGVEAHSKSEWDPKRNGSIDRDLERDREKKVKDQLRGRLKRIPEVDELVDPGHKNSWTIIDVLTGMREGYSDWWDWNRLKDAILSAKNVDDFVKTNTARARSWRFAHESYSESKDISQYGKFFKVLKTNFDLIQKSMKWVDTALKGIKGSAQAAFEKDLLKMGLSMKDLEVAMSHVENWTSMSRKKLDPSIWPLLQKLSVDSSSLPKVIYRGIFIDGAKIKDQAKFLKQWFPGSKPGVSQGKATSWSVDKGTAAEFMTDQDFIKDAKGGYYVLLRWKVDPAKVIADLRNLPVDHKFWNQQELIVDPAARDYEVDAMIPGSSGSDAHSEFIKTIKGGQGAWGRSKSEFALNFLNTPYETLSPNQRIEFKQIAKMTVGEFQSTYPGIGIDAKWKGVAMPIWNYLSKYSSNMVPTSISRNRVEFKFAFGLQSIEYLRDPVLDATIKRVKKETGYNQFAGSQEIVSNVGFIELIDDDYYDINLKIHLPTKCSPEVMNPNEKREIDQIADKALNTIFNEVGESNILNVMNRRQSEQKLPKNINIQIQ
jgi:hypothetical protein